MIKITLPSQYEDRQPIKDLVERLMGRDPAPRFAIRATRFSRAVRFMIARIDAEQLLPPLEWQ